MRAKDLVVGESYRHKEHTNYGWAKAIKILQPKQDENPHNRIVVKCKWSQVKNDNFSITKYFKPSDLVAQ